MRLRSFRVIFVLFASTVVAIAQTSEDEETEGPKTSSEAASEVKRIESLAIPPTQFEIEEELKDAKQQRKASEQRAKFSAAQLERVQSIKQALAAAGGNPMEVKEQISAFRKEVDDQIRAKSFNREKLKIASSNIKIVSALPDNWVILRDYVAPADKDIMNYTQSFVRNLKTTPTSENELEAYRNKFLSDDAVARSDQIPQVLQRAAESAQRKIDDAQKSASTTTEAWGKRYNALSEQLRKLQSGTVTSLVASLPLLMAILATFGVAAIFLVRFFPESVQVEWVASGQVIQLLTVVTLLLIILCLALTNIIREETIGTLLGGIGGYVLSQGIGRAAGRAAARAALQPPPETSASEPTGGQSG